MKRCCLLGYYLCASAVITLAILLFPPATITRATSLSVRRIHLSKPQQQRSSSFAMTFTTTSSQEGDTVIDVPVLKQRLVDAGVPAELISLQADQDWVPEKTMRNFGRKSSSSSLEGEKKKHGQREEVHKIQQNQQQHQQQHQQQQQNPVIEIKTLVWKITFRSTVKPPNAVFVVTACRINDKVDVNILRELLLSHHDDMPHCDGVFEAERIELAPLEVAEDLTGFPSGCIPPVGHAKSHKVSKLYIDSSIISGFKDDSGTPVSDNNYGIPFASIGSGIPGQSLLLPMSCVLTAAANTPHGVRIESIVRNPQTTDERSVVNTEEERVQRKMDRMGRQPKPKDRLKEYQRMKSTLEKAKLLRTTARKKGRFQDMQSLVKEAVDEGDFLHLFDVQPEEGFSKNCLHLAAWRGDFETVQLLVETAQKVQAEGRHPPGGELDIVNTISRGDGNYGKSAIFYALTQCRKDVVRYLVSEGASLLLVNNKGQTPCSIAVSHMDEEMRQFLFQEEARQLRAGGTFANYRASNSDGKLYGDLDPRFSIDDDNQGGDIEDSINEYQASVAKSDLSTIFRGIPTQFEPRSVRATVRWWNRSENATLSEIQKVDGNRSGIDTGPITFTQPREVQLRKRDGIKQAPVRKAASPILDDLPFSSVNVDAVDLLTIDQVLRDPTMESHDQVLIVNCSESIQELEHDIDAAIEASKKRNDKESDDSAFVSSSWGLDCEWKPGSDRGKDNPVATLQLSTRRRAYLIDVQSICQDYVFEPTAIELQLNASLSKLFAHPRIPVIGFGILQDLGKLAASFPHLSSFSSYASVMDLQVMSTTIYSKSTRPLLSSLQKMVALLLGKRLDKSQQCSDWTRRPLSDAQVQYATLDAAVLPLLLKTMMETSQTVARYNGQFSAVHSCSLLSCLRYLLTDNLPCAKDCLEPETNDQKKEWHVPMGSIRPMLGLQFARQCWPLNQATPGLPKLVAANLNRVTKKEILHLTKVGERTMKKPKPIQLRTLSGNLDNLPIPGIKLGHTKDSCVYRVVGHNFMNTLPEGTHIGFNRRSGVVETNNAWIIFCNFGGNDKKSYQRGRVTSEFSEGGRFLTFNLNPERQDPGSSEKSLFSRIKLRDDGGSKIGGERRIILFARDGTSSQFLYCGECQYCDHITLESGTIDLVLELLDFEKLTGSNRVSSTFVDLVEWREQVYKKIPALAG